MRTTDTLDPSPVSDGWGDTLTLDELIRRDELYWLAALRSSRRGAKPHREAPPD